MALITPKDIADIKAALVELAPVTEEPITYKRFDHMADGDPVMGTPSAPVYVDSATTAGIRELSVEEVAVSGGAYILGDIEFSVRMEQPPSYQDRLVYNALTWKPKSINKVFLSEVLWWEIRAGKE